MFIMKTFYISTFLRNIISLFLLFGIGLVKTDHTTFCINLPDLTYKHDELKSMGVHMFPRSSEKLNWSAFEAIGSNRRIFGEADLDLRQRAYITPDTYAAPNGELNIYRIKGKNDRYLNGWFRIEFKLIRSSTDPMRNAGLIDAVKALILYVQDDSFRRQNVGEFVWNFPTTAGCPKSDATKYMVISCGGASRSEPLVGNTVLFVRNNTKKDGNIFPPASRGKQIVPEIGPDKNSLNFYIRIPMQACNQKRLLLFRARVIMDHDALNVGYDIYRAFMLSTIMYIGDATVPGGTDALPSPNGEQFLKCNYLITTEPQAYLNPTVPWYAKYGTTLGNFGSQVSGFEKGSGLNEQRVQPLAACQGAYFEGRCRNSMYEFVSSIWSGYDFDADRLRDISYQNEAHPNIIPICESFTPLRNTPPAYGIDQNQMHIPPILYFDKHLDFPNSLEYLRTKKVPCARGYNQDANCNISKLQTWSEGSGGIHPPGHPETLKIHGKRFVRNAPQGKILGAPRQFDLLPDDAGNAGYIKENNGPTGTRYAEVGFTLLVWGMRKGHSTFAAVVTFFLVPVNLFMTRYMKESFMGRRLLFSRIWYQIHAHGTFMTSAFLLGSLLIIILSRSYLGVSLTRAAFVHRTLGWISVAIFIMLSVLGGFRGFEEPYRKISIAMHWFIGMLFYIFLLILSMTAVFIPGNGVAKIDTSTEGLYDDGEVYSNGSLIHVFIWIVFEAVMHAVMMGNMIAFDKNMGVKNGRLYLPVPIPVIKEFTSMNSSGHGLRVIALCIYVLCSFISVSVYFISFIATVKWHGKGLGPMSCTHNATTLELLSEIPDIC